MKVLILNGGSSSLKYHLLDMQRETTVLKGNVSNIGGDTSGHSRTTADGDKTADAVDARDHDVALEIVFRTIEAQGVGELPVVGHRVVHGGEKLQAPVVIDDDIEAAIEACSPLAPLHNPINLQIVRTARRKLPQARHVAVFDTAFHNTIPDHAAVYGIPHELYEQDRIRRYGFHGNSHEYVALLASQFLERPLRRLKLITCHLGSGASVCAIDRGNAIDTSMGMTPLEGLVMGTRSGDLDPAIIFHLAREKDMSIDEIDRLLNKESGLLGLSGVSNDMQEVLQAADAGNPRALLAIKVFCYRVRKYIGSYMLSLGWVNAVIFTGGIGENSRGIRLRIMQNTEKYGLGVDEVKNQRCHVVGDTPVVDISAPSAHAHVLVAHTNEELMMARKCLDAVKYARGSHLHAMDGVRPIPIGISAHHVHLCRADVEALFGEGHQLTPIKDLKQPAQFACEERVNLIGPRGRVDNVRILGPERTQTQVEISRTEEFKLGIDAPIRESGDLDGTPSLTLEGTAGKVVLPQGVICAKRHIHMSPEDAEQFGVHNGDHVLVKVAGEGRELIFGDVVIRVKDSYSLEMHIDTDEANAAELSQPATGVLVSIQSRSEARNR